MTVAYEYAIELDGIRRALFNLDCADTFEAASALAATIPGARVQRRTSIAGPWEPVPDLAETFPDLTADQLANSERYWAAVCAGGLRRSVLDDPDREANLARVREAMVANNEGGVVRWPDEVNHA